MVELEGKRNTCQRRLLLELILRADGHVDADELYRQAREQEPRLSLSTVYRNLKLFKRLGLVDECHLGDEHHHYEARVGEHHHLTCLCCGRVVEFDSPVVQNLKQGLAAENDFEIVAAEIRLEGYCARCRQSGKRD